MVKKSNNIIVKTLLLTAIVSGITVDVMKADAGYSLFPNTPVRSLQSVDSIDLTKSFIVSLAHSNPSSIDSLTTSLFYSPTDVTQSGVTFKGGMLYVLQTNWHEYSDNGQGSYSFKNYFPLGEAKKILGSSGSSTELTEDQKTVIKNLIANVEGNQKVDGNQEITGNSTVKGDSTVEGSQTVKGDSTVEGSQTVKGDSITEGNNTTNGNSTVKGDLGVEGSTNLKDTTVDGALDVTGNATINGSQTVKGDSTVEGNSTTNGNSTVKGDLGVEGSTNLKDTNITGKLTVNGNQEVTGDIYAHGSVVANNAGFNNLAVINGATIGNNTDFVNMKDGNIVATGSITALGNFGVAGNTVLNGDVQMNSNASVKGDLNVGGSGNFAGTLSAQDAYLGGQSVLGRFAQQDQKINKTGAAAAAMAGLHPLDFDEEQKLNFAAATGSYHGSSAIALGMFYRPNEQVMFNLSGSSSGSEHMYTFGASFALDRPSGTHVSSRRALTEKVQQLSQVNEAVIKQSMELQAKNDELQSQIAELRQIVMEMKKSA